MDKRGKQKFKLGLLNIRSMNTGQDELVCTMDNFKPDILALNETWFKKGQESSAPKIPGYVVKLSPRPSGHKGGGVGFNVRRGLRTRIVQHPESPLEQMWLEVRLPGSGRMAVGTAYRPDSTAKTRVPVSTAIDALSESLNCFADYNHIFLLTDFNVDLSKPNLSPAPECLKFFSHRNLTQIVTEPTRITEQTATLIDLILTDSPHLCKRLTVKHNPLLGDHAMVLTELYIEKPKKTPQFIRTRLLHKINEDSFGEDLKSIPRHEILEANDVESMVN